MRTSRRHGTSAMRQTRTDTQTHRHTHTHAVHSLPPLSLSLSSPGAMSLISSSEDDGRSSFGELPVPPRRLCPRFPSAKSHPTPAAFPKGPCTHIVCTLALKYSLYRYIGPKVYTIWVHGPLGIADAATRIHLVRAPAWSWRHTCRIRPANRSCHARRTHCLAAALPLPRCYLDPRPNLP